MQKFQQKLGQHKISLLISSGILLLLLCGLAYLFFDPVNTPTAVTTAFVKDAVTKQQKIEKEIQSTFQAGTYTFTHPLVIQNPYQVAPLTALVIFDTPQPSQVSIHVAGKNLLANVDFTFAEFATHHEIPIYGLYADTLNHVTLNMKSQSGANAQTIIDLQTEPLPGYLQ